MCGGDGSQKQGVGEVVARGSLPTRSSGWLGKAVVPNFEVIKVLELHLFISFVYNGTKGVSECFSDNHEHMLGA